MPGQKEKNPQQGRWEQFLSSVQKEVLENAKFSSPEGNVLKYFLSMQFLQQEEGSRLPAAIAKRTMLLAQSQASWSGAPLRDDVTSEELNALRENVRRDAEELEETRKAKADSDNYITVNYPKLIDVIMESIRLRGHTKLPEEAIGLLTRSAREESMEQFGDTLYLTFNALFDMPENSPIQALPSGVRQPERVEKTQMVSVNVDPGFHWREIGIDPGGADYQGYNKALLDLAAKFPEILPPAEKKSRLLVLELKTLPDAEVLGMLQQTFQRTTVRSEPEKPIARMLALIAWEEGNKVQDWHDFVDHARTIMGGTATTLLPEKSSDAAPTQALDDIPTQKTSVVKEVRTDRFPQTEEEIERYIRETLVRFNDIIKQKGRTVEWPMNPGEFANRVIGLNKRKVDEGERFVKPEHRDGRGAPYFSRLSYIKLLALEQYQPINTHQLSKALRRFDDIYKRKFTKR